MNVVNTTKMRKLLELCRRIYNESYLPQSDDEPRWEELSADDQAVKFGVFLTTMLMTGEE